MFIMSSDDKQLLVNFNKQIESKLLTISYDTFSNDDKNDLIAVLAQKENKVFNEITNEFVLDYHRKLKKSVLSQMCDDTITEGFTASNGHTYRVNRDDQINMMGKKGELRDDATITTVNWRTEDAGYIDHTRDEWLQVYKESFTFKETQLGKYKQCKQDIDAATTHDQIIAVTLQ